MFLTFILLLSFSQAQEGCLQLNLLSQPVGTQCQTSTQDRFERYQESVSGAMGIKDLHSNGKIWFDTINVGITQNEAFNICNERGGQVLPTVDEYLDAETRGLREAFADDMYDLFMWTASYNEEDNTEGMGFSGSYGQRFFIPWSNHNRTNAVRCIQL